MLSRKIKFHGFIPFGNQKSRLFVGSSAMDFLVLSLS
jgi:hypothetical protein